MSLKVTNGFLLFRCFLSRSVATDQFGSLIKRKNRAIIPGSLFSSQFRSCATSETGLKSKESLRSQVIKMAAGALPAEVKEKLDKIADVRIDETGRFKYILIKVFATDKDGKHIDSNSKLVVRGRSDCPYHADIFDKFQEEIASLDGVDDDVLGGGRIERTSNNIFVFGYSQGYGKADHTLTVEVLKKHYPNYEIKWSDDGY